MRKWLVACVCGLLFILSACSGSSSNGGLDGETLFQSNCASCHTGNMSLTQGEINLSVDEIEEIIRYGTDAMPPIKKLTDDEIATIANYLVGGE